MPATPNPSPSTPQSGPYAAYSAPAYSAEGDMLIGDIIVSSSISKISYIRQAAEEMDTALGQVYVLPIDLDGLSDQSRLLLKRISNRIATGELLMTLDISKADQALRAYATDLMTSGRADLCALLSGSMILVGATRIDATTTGDTGPGISCHDSASAVDNFEFQTMTYRPFDPNPIYGPSWQPGL